MSSVFAKKTDHNNTSALVSEINALLSEMRRAKESGKTQKGGNNNLVSDINNLLSELGGEDSNLTEAEVFDLAMKGGAKKSKKSKGKKGKSKSKGKKGKSKSKSKSKGKKGKSKSKSKTKSQSRPKKAKKVKKSKSKGKTESKKATKSKSKSKSKTRKIGRPEGGDGKKKRGANQYIIDLTALRAHIKNKLPDETLNNVGAMSKAAAKILSGNDKDLEKAKKNFNSASFLKDYNTAKKEIEAKREAKKANKV